MEQQRAWSFSSVSFLLLVVQLAQLYCVIAVENCTVPNSSSASRFGDVFEADKAHNIHALSWSRCDVA
jgi:hypothetical protein